MANIRFYSIDNNYIGFEGDRDVIYELRNQYSFYAPNYKWDKRFKLGYWDGKISMINLRDKRIYRGLLENIMGYLDKEKILYDVSDVDFIEGREFDFDQIEAFYENIEAPFEPFESQSLAIQNCISSTRNIILAPTSNGKSYIIHGLIAYYKLMKKRTLLIINRSQLVLQLKSNFEDEYNSSKIYSTSTIYDDDNDTDVMITTWQSIVDQPQSWFKQFDVIIADEVHTFKAKSLINIIDKCGHVEYRHGFTATLDNDSKTDAMTLEGMFGTPLQTTTLAEQIEMGLSSRPIIYLCVLKYNITDRRELIKQIKDRKNEAMSAGKKNIATIDFLVESEFLEQHEGRNALIMDLVNKQKGNTLVAFKNHDHGRSLHDMIEEKTDLPLFFVNSTVSKTKRFDIQNKITELLESVAVVSFGTFSTGINIPNLNNLIIASQVKSKITVPQLIGRMVRLAKGKTTANVFDICDDLTHNGNKNIFFRHFEERMKYYLKNGFEIHTKIINMS